MIKPTLNMNNHWMVLYKMSFCVSINKSKMAAIIHKFNIGPCGENIFKIILIWNHWTMRNQTCLVCALDGPWQIVGICVDLKSGNTIGNFKRIGKWRKKNPTKTVENRLNGNGTWIVIGLSSSFVCWSKIQVGRHCRTLLNNGNMN